MKKSVIPYFLMIVFIPIISFSQVTLAQTSLKTDLQNPTVAEFSDKNGGNSNETYTGGVYDHADIGRTGSMYMNDLWFNGKIVLNDHTSFTDIPIRYNVYHRQMQFIRGEDTLAFSNPDEIDYLEFNNQLFVHTEYINQDKVKKDYFEVLTDGDCKLLYRRIVKFHKVVESESGNLEDDIFVPCCEFYVKKDNKPAVCVELKKKSIACAFGDKQDEVAAFIKSNKLKMKDKEDLKKVFNFYNGLGNIAD